ncbi:hypothetical protein C6P40_003296 [Pichia californica]|uniref:Uncharacterized protein n=1 Tax=Pichia californica TaxID=460514 RepID=A0A9P6WGM3_9ASCO|nr:hypothetical protein C6P40_003296 [[Candida] californica]
MIFSITKIADLVFNYLNKLGIKIGFARHDNKLIHCDLDENCKTNKIVNKNIKNSNSELILLPPFDNNSNKILQDSIPIDEKYPGNQIFINESNDSNFNKLEIPNPPIQMQSPPPSPYEGWIERPEEPPSITTIGFHPKTLSHLLYTYDDNNNNNNSNSIDSTIKNNSNNSIKMKKVFSSVLDSNYPTKSNLSELEDLNIGDGLHDNDDENNILKGSLFQNKVLENKERKITSNLKIPIVIVDSNEAESLKLHAAEMDKIKEN